jgi:hypothetical protein
MSVALTAASVFLFVADQKGREASEIRNLAERVKPEHRPAYKGEASELSGHSASLFRSSFLFVFGFLYSLAGLIAYLGFEPILSHAPPLTDKEAHNLVSLVSFLSLPPETVAGTTLSWGLLGEATVATTSGAIRAIFRLKKMLPRTD